MGSACSSGGTAPATGGEDSSKQPNSSPSPKTTGAATNNNNNHQVKESGAKNRKRRSVDIKPTTERPLSTSSSLSSCSIPGHIIVGASDEDDEPSRPATPFSRPLTGRIAQRPRTTTIFEREQDAKKCAKNGSLSGEYHVDTTTASELRPRSRCSSVARLTNSTVKRKC
jgi:hypothetical protein